MRLQDLILRWKFRSFQTALRTAIVSGKPHAVKLLSHLMDGDSRGRRGDTLLHSAALSNSSETFHFLFNYLNKLEVSKSSDKSSVVAESDEQLKSDWLIKYRPGK